MNSEPSVLGRKIQEIDLTWRSRALLRDILLDSIRSSMVAEDGHVMYWMSVAVYSVLMRTILTDALQVLGEEQIFQNECFGLEGWYMRTVQMEYGGFHLKAKHSMDVRSGICEESSGKG